MPLISLNRFPAVIECGDTAKITLGFGDFPANSSSAVLILNQRGASPLSVAGTPNGNSFDFVIPAAITDALAPGIYDYAIRCTYTATGDSQIPRNGSGTVQLLPNLANTVAKSTAQQQLDAANSAFSTLIANPQLSVNFNGQSFTKESQSNLISIIARLEAKVRAEIDQESAQRGCPRSRSIRPFFS